MATKPAKAQARQRRAKAEIAEEFEQIRTEVEAARESAGSKLAEAAAARAEEVGRAVEGVTVENVVQRISGLGLEVSKSLADLSAKLVEEVQLLSTLRDAVAAERAELERLHKIDVGATAVDQMVFDYARQKEELEAEIAARRAAWEEEAKTVERERREQEENLKRGRQREIEDYEYRKTLERKKAQDKYDEEIRLIERKNKDRQEALEKDWQVREAALAEREAELESLRQQVAAFPEELQREVAQAVAQAKADAEQKYQQQIIVATKDAEADKRVAEIRIKTLEGLLERQSAQAAALEKQLEEAKRQVEEIAVKAIEGASGSRALAHINQIAMEQAKNRPRGE